MSLLVKTLVCIFVLGINNVQCQHAKDSEAEELSSAMLKKLNQTGTKAEMMSLAANLTAMPTNVSKDISKSRYLDDFADFVVNLNEWLILGQWARYHLNFFTGDLPIPKLPSSIDQTVMICTVTKFPSSLTKNFVGLTNSFLTIIHYVSFQTDISIEGLISSNNTTEVFFALNQDDLYEQNNNWVVNTFAIPMHIKNMTVILQPRSSGDAIWAIASIAVNGTVSPEKMASPIVLKSKEVSTKKVVTPPTTSPNTTTQVPTASKPSNITASQNTTIDSPQAESIKNSTELPPVNVSTAKAAESSIMGEHIKNIHGVATAIWDAFYVFLALFCACMLALVVLVMRQR